MEGRRIWLVVAEPHSPLLNPTRKRFLLYVLAEKSSLSPSHGLELSLPAWALLKAAECPFLTGALEILEHRGSGAAPALLQRAEGLEPGTLNISDGIFLVERTALESRVGGKDENWGYLGGE